MLAGEGLYPSSKGKRVEFSVGKLTVIDGPFSESKELVAGYWIWQVESIEEAVEWVKRMPSPADGPKGVIEIRPIFEYEDFDVNYPPEIRSREAEMAAELSGKSEVQSENKIFEYLASRNDFSHCCLISAAEAAARHLQSPPMRRAGLLTKTVLRSGAKGDFATVGAVLTAGFIGSLRKEYQHV
jgi:hypothetical protein